MRTFTIAVLALQGVAIGQAVITPNPLFARSEGPSACVRLGAFSEGRYQLADGNLRGGARTFKSIAFRPDHRNHDISTSMGRTWSGVQIYMSECSQATLGRTFSTNPTTTPSLVFSSSLSWPIQLGAPATLPAPFGVRIPFSSAWSYAGTADVLTDMRFAGGKLANQAAWPRAKEVPYYLDSFHVGLVSRGSPVTFGATNGGCFDSGAPTRVAATVRYDTASYGPSISNGTLRDKITLEASGRNLGRNVSAILAFTFNADPVGLRHPDVACNRIHLDFRRTWFLNPVRTDAVGSVGPFYFGVPSGQTNYTAFLTGVQMVVQGVWTDTLEGRLRLSAASRNGFVVQPYPNPSDARLSAVYDPNPASTTASNSYVGNPVAIPIAQYGQ